MKLEYDKITDKKWTKLVNKCKKDASEQMELMKLPIKNIFTLKAMRLYLQIKVLFFWKIFSHEKCLYKSFLKYTLKFVINF